MKFDFEYISRDPARLREALDACDIATLAMVLVQLTEDYALLDTVAQYVHGPWNYSVDMPAAIQADLRDRLVVVLREYAAGRRWLPAPPSAAHVQAMMSACVGEQVSREYVPMMLEELAFQGGDPKGVAWRKPQAVDAAKEFPVVVIGAGMSGVLAAIKLQDMGIPFTVIEKNATVGGTWLENCYPGCGVDTPNHLYSYSFEPDHIWTQFFSKQRELQTYFERCVDRHALRGAIRFGTEVVSAHFEETDASWTVVTRELATGELETRRARAVISAAGQLNRPQTPPFKGLETFRGTVVHTGRWDPALDLTGKRVAMVGSGASAMQAGPTIAPIVSHLTVFQRTPHWVLANQNYHENVSDGKKWALEHLPYYARWYRFQLFWAFSDGIHPALQIDPEWPHPERSLNKRNERFRINLTRYAEDQLGGDKALLAKVIPSYPPYGKRMLVDNHWFKMLKRSNVALVTSGIDHIEPDAIVDAEGIRHEVDVIVMATGFDAHRMLFPMDIRGREGVSLRDVWGDDDPRAYLGITVPRFPNFFILYGPNTHLGHGGSIVFNSEAQMRYIGKCLRELIEGDFQTMEISEDVHDDYCRRCDEAHSRMVWAAQGTDNWYRNAKGRVVSNSPWRLVDYWKWTEDLDPGEYVMKPVERGSPQ